MKYILFAMLIQTQVLAQPPSCEVVLSACAAVVAQDTKQIGHLEQDIKLLEDKVVEEDKTPLLPWWALAGIAGLVGGTFLGSRLK
jgi:hypothetical protein